MQRISISILLGLLVVWGDPAQADQRVAIRISTGEFLGAQGLAPEGAMIANAVSRGIPASDVREEVMTDGQLKTLLDSQYAPDPVTAQAQRLSEIKQQAVERFKGYELYADMQSVIDYKAALRAVPTTAATEMAALPDVASVKNYQPVWPAKPNL